MSQFLTAKFVFDRGVLLQNKTLVVENGVIVDMMDASELSDAVYLVTSAFTDLQVNGGGGVLFNSSPTKEGLKQIITAHRSLGTGWVLPTLITDAPEVMERAVDAILDENGQEGLLGVHLEGPHISQDKRGTHAAEFIRRFDSVSLAQIERLRAHDVTIMLTLAPETLPKETLLKLCAMGVIISAGHSSASFQVTNAAIDLGVKCFTHLHNAMPQMTSRDPGMIAAALLSDAYCGLICDGIHVDYAMLKIAHNARPNKRRNFIVSDAMATVGGPDHFELYGKPIKQIDGRLINSEGALAGAHIDMLSSVRNLIMHAKFSLEDALAMATVVPRAVLGLSPQSLLDAKQGEWIAVNEAFERL